MVACAVRMRPGAMLFSRGASALKRPQIVHKFKDAIQYVASPARRLGLVCVDGC